jgi:hypothetical protein
MDRGLSTRGSSEISGSGQVVVVLIEILLTDIVLAEIGKLDTVS